MRGKTDPCEHVAMRRDVTALFLAAVVTGAAASVRAQPAMLPFDHIHLNEPAAEAEFRQGIVH